MSNNESASGRPPLRGGKLAHLLGVDLKTLHNWYRAGKIRARKTLGGQLLFDPADVLADYRTAQEEDPDVRIPEAFTEFLRTGSTPTAAQRKRVRAAKPRAETSGAA